MYMNSNTGADHCHDFNKQQKQERKRYKNKEELLQKLNGTTLNVKRLSEIWEET